MSRSLRELPAHLQPPEPEQDTRLTLRNPYFCQTLLAILVLRNNGGKNLTFTQDEFDKVAGLYVLEGMDENRNYIVGLGYPSSTDG